MCETLQTTWAIVFDRDTGPGHTFASGPAVFTVRNPDFKKKRFKWPRASEVASDRRACTRRFCRALVSGPPILLMSRTDRRDFGGQETLEPFRTTACHGILDYFEIRSSHARGYSRVNEQFHIHVMSRSNTGHREETGFWSDIQKERAEQTSREHLPVRSRDSARQNVSFVIR